MLMLLSNGCTVLRYKFENALNQIPKDSKVTKITNTYIEYNKYITNTTQIVIVIENKYRAYYSIDGQIIKTQKINNE